MVHKSKTTKTLEPEDLKYLDLETKPDLGKFLPFVLVTISVLLLTTSFFFDFQLKVLTFLVGIFLTIYTILSFSL